MVIYRADDETRSSSLVFWNPRNQTFAVVSVAVHVKTIPKSPFPPLLTLVQKSCVMEKCSYRIYGVNTRVSKHIRTHPDWISGHPLDIRISNLWISGHPDKSRQIQTNPDEFLQPFRGEVYMVSQNQQERANNEQRASIERAKTE